MSPLHQDTWPGQDALAGHSWALPACSPQLPFTSVRMASLEDQVTCLRVRGTVPLCPVFSETQREGRDSPGLPPAARPGADATVRFGEKCQRRISNALRSMWTTAETGNQQNTASLSEQEQGAKNTRPGARPYFPRHKVGARRFGGTEGPPTGSQSPLGPQAQSTLSQGTESPRHVPRAASVPRARSIPGMTGWGGAGGSRDVEGASGPSLETRPQRGAERGQSKSTPPTAPSGVGDGEGPFEKRSLPRRESQDSCSGDVTGARTRRHWLVPRNKRCCSRSDKTLVSLGKDSCLGNSVCMSLTWG